MNRQITIADIETMNQDLLSDEGTIHSLSRYIEHNKSLKIAFFRNREGEDWHTLLLRFLFLMFKKIRDSPVLSSSDKANILIDFESETEEIVQNLLEGEMKFSNYKFRSHLFIYLGDQIQLSKNLGLELSESSIMRICQVAVIVESHDKILLEDLGQFLERAFRGGADRIVQCPHETEAILIILDCLWGSSPQYRAQLNSVQGSIISIRMLILLDRTEECSTGDGIQFVKQLVSNAMRAFSLCAESQKDARAKLFEVICIGIICDPSGHFVADEISVLFLLEKSMWLICLERDIRNIHLYKSIVLAANLKLSTVRLNDTGDESIVILGDGTLPHIRSLTNVVNALPCWISTAENQCMTENCFVCGIYSTTQNCLPRVS